MAKRHWGLLGLLALAVLHWAAAADPERHACDVNPESQCNFVCDCTDCADELSCGYECDFEETIKCGWQDVSVGSVYKWERRQRGNVLPESGPSSDFTTGTSTGWFMAVTPVDAESAAVALLKSPLMRDSSPTCRLHLRYFIWDSGHTGVDSSVLWGTIHRQDSQDSVVWRPEATSVRGWREASVYLGRISGQFHIQLHSQRQRGRRGDVALDQLELRHCALPVPEHTCGEGSLLCQSGGCVEERQVCDGTEDCGDGTDERACDEHFSCNFEGGPCEWDMRTLSSIKFQRTTQASISLPYKPNRGPGRDHTGNTDSGYFLYITKPDDVEQLKGDWSSFQSAVFEPTSITHPCRMTFYTHQFGPRAGGLSVLLVTNGSMDPVWQRGGELGDLWVKAQVEFVVDGIFQILFVGAIRDEEYGGIAIDDIVMSPGCRRSNDSSPSVGHPSPPTHPCTVSNKLCDFNMDCEGGADEAQCGDFSFAKGSSGWTDASLGAQGWALMKSDIAKGEHLYVTDAPGQQLSEAWTRTPPLGPSGPACTVLFKYRLTGSLSDIGELSLSVIDMVLGTKTRLWEHGGKTGAGDWVGESLYIGARNQRFQLELGGLARKISNETQIAVKDVQYEDCHPQYIPATESDLLCNFESDLCGWYQDQMDNFDWKVHAGMDHTIGIGKSLTADVWDPSLRGLTGRLLSFPHLPTTNTYCLSFYYKLYGPQTGTLNVKVLHSDASETLLWTRTGAHGNHWHYGLCPIPAQPISFQLVFEALRSGFDGRVAIDDVALLTRPCMAPSACSFEGTSCGYVSSEAVVWVQQNGAFGGIRPAPEVDHTLDTSNGFYMIAVTSGDVLAAGNVMTLISPVRSPSAVDECVQFWYYMTGDKPGTLNVYVKPQRGERVKVFSENLNQGPSWRHGNGNITMTVDWQLEFEAVGAGGTDSRIALDDITFTPHSCPLPDAACSLERGLCSWSNTQNPTLDLLDWDVSSVASEEHYQTPPYDHTLGSERGHFLFLPSTPRDTQGQSAWLLSQHLPPTKGTCLRFWVHKLPSYDGDLRVWKLSDGKREELFWLQEDNGIWRHYSIDIIALKQYQVVFEGIKGTKGLMALDDLDFSVGVNCAGESTDTAPTKPITVDKGGIAASVVVLLLLLVTMAAILAFYFRHRNRREPREATAREATSPVAVVENFSNELYENNSDREIIIEREV